MFLSSKKGRKGFTLIELLIVVAIIAILAAIAVPNFLEAQTRSKVARMKADMRSLATAIEAYLVDNNAYPASGFRGSPETWGALVDAGEDDAAGGEIKTNSGLIALSTPITFISKIPQDVFSRNTGNHGWGTDSASGGTCPPQFFSGVDELTDVDDSGSPDDADITELLTRPRRFWVLVSFGPDAIGQVQHTEGWEDNPDVTDANGYNEEDVYFVGSPSDVGWEGIPYDSTNGSLSDGDVYHWASGDVQPGFTE